MFYSLIAQNDLSLNKIIVIDNYKVIVAVHLGIIFKFHKDTKLENFYEHAISIASISVNFSSPIRAQKPFTKFSPIYTSFHNDGEYVCGL